MIDYCDECEEITTLDCCPVCGRAALCPECAEECELSHEREEDEAGE